METSSDNQSADLAGTIKTLVDAITDLRKEVASQKQEMKAMNEHRKQQQISASPQLLLLNRQALGSDHILSNVLNVTGISNTYRKNGCADTFELFPKLPLELRMTIWKAAMPSGRLFEPFFEPPHRAYGPSAFSNITFTIGPNGVINVPANVNQGNGHANLAQIAQMQIAAAQAVPGAAGHIPQQTVPLARPEPPPVRFSAMFLAPKARMACREARRAAAQVGAFEFGIYRTARRGYWFNHSTDMVKISTDLLSHAFFNSLDLSRIQRIAFCQAQFKAEPNVVSVLELILSTGRSCREIILIYDQESRFSYRHPATHAKTFTHFLDDNDIIGNHAFPATRNLPDGPITWAQLRRTVIAIWEEYMLLRRLDIASIPRFTGMDLVRSGRLF